MGGGVYDRSGANDSYKKELDAAQVLANSIKKCVVLGLMALGTLNCGCWDQSQALRSEYQVDLGILHFVGRSQPSRIEHTFELLNSTGQPLNLTIAKKSCACVEVDAPSIINAGAKFNIVIGFQQRGIPELRQEFVKFKTGDADQPTLHLQVNCESVPAAVLEPKAVYSAELKDGKTSTVNGYYCAFISEKDVRKKLVPQVEAPEGLHVTLGESALFQRWKGIWVYRIPFAIDVEQAITLGSGSRKRFAVSINVLGDHATGISIDVSRHSSISLTPKQLFLAPNSDAVSRLSLESQKPIHPTNLMVGGKPVPESLWQQTKDSSITTVIELQTQAFREWLLDNFEHTLNQYELLVRLNDGELVVPIVRF